MAETTTTFAVKLEDQVSGAADAAAASLVALQKKIDADTAALRAMQSQMNTLQAGTEINITRFKKLDAAIAAKAATIARARSQLSGMSGAMSDAGSASGKLASGFEEIARAARASIDATKSNIAWQQRWKAAASGQTVTRKITTGSPAKAPAALQGLGRASSGAAANLNDYNDALEGGGVQMPQFIKGLLEGTAALGPLAIGIAAAAAALGVLGLAVGAVVGLAKFAITSQEALEGVSQEAINVAKRTPIAREQISKLADELAKTGLRGEALERALEKAIPKRFGKDAAKSMLGFSVQIAKAKENAALLFSGIKTDGLQKALASFLRLLTDSTVAGYALKTILEELVQPVIDGLAKAGPSANQFFKGMIIGALKAGIVILTLRNNVAKLFGTKGSDLSVDFKKLGEFAAIAAIGVVVLSAAIGGLITVVFGATGGVLALGLAIGIAIGVGVAMAVEAGMALWRWLENTTALLAQGVGEIRQAGSDLASGFAAGITSGASKAITAATNMAKGAIKAAKDALGIASPSKVFKAVGKNTGESMAGGQEQSAGKVERATRNMLSVPDDAGGSPDAVRTGGAGGSMSVVIEQININGVTGADDPEMLTKIKLGVIEALESVARSRGLATE